MSVTTTQGDEQVLTFQLDGQEYCVSITAVDEIVDYDQTVTALPETDSHVAGVMDLRGRTTTVVDPKEVLDTDGDGDGDHVVVFDSESDDANPVGWIVDSVSQVIGFDLDEINEDVESSLARGVVRNDDDRFIVWLDPSAF
ncbi:chemotaxis protein CheW [Halobacterium wangiae]|uniref:chemotaxis protein CheW n=1 Tax=Halobacterium wangiae TaxID=2902623 RepID=UPI001E566CC0|nr:chemotaxis protein CheW [Halobacterium wangiae]